MRLRIESLAVTRLSLFHDDEPVGSHPATGFLYRYGQSLALVSNWHVFTGMSPLRRDALPGVRYPPNTIKFHVNVRDPGGTSIRVEEVQIRLHDGSRSFWWQHKAFVNASGAVQIADIAVFILDDLAAFASTKASVSAVGAAVLVNCDEHGEPQSASDGYPRVGADVFILGYPQGLSRQGVLPIWKRGSIASEPLFFVMDQAPAMLVDAVTRAGMSGSPVLNFGGEITDDAGRITSLYANRDPWLIGVNAGREGVTQDDGI